jgi:AcrR family transcriptional regulator
MRNLEKTNIPPKPKWRRKPQCRPDDILDGALKEFSSRGFVGARIEDIARHSGLSKGTIYLYFDSKEDMLKALVRRSVIPIAEALKHLADDLTSDDPDRKASDILRAMIMLIGDRLSDQKIHSIPLLIIAEAGNFPELVNFYRKEVIDVAMCSIETVIANGVNSGEFRKLETNLAVRSLMSVMIMHIIWTGVFAQPDEPEISSIKLLNSHIEIFLNGVRARKET